MFNCHFCKKTSKSYEKMERVVLTMRNKIYPNESFGTEIVNEKQACKICAEEHANDRPEIVAGEEFFQEAQE